jgi:hypothetical protein
MNQHIILITAYEKSVSVTIKSYHNGNVGITRAAGAI